MSPQPIRRFIYIYIYFILHCVQDDNKFDVCTNNLSDWKQTRCWIIIHRLHMLHCYHLTLMVWSHEDVLFIDIFTKQIVFSFSNEHVSVVIASSDLLGGGSIAVNRNLINVVIKFIYGMCTVKPTKRSTSCRWTRKIFNTLKCLTRLSCQSPSQQFCHK